MAKATEASNPESTENSALDTQIAQNASGAFADWYGTMRARARATVYQHFYTQGTDEGGGVPLGEKEALKTGDSRVKLSVDGIEREYRVHIPPHAPDAHLPVVVVLHGTSPQYKTAIEESISTMGFNKEADKNGFIAAYPIAQTRTFEYHPLLRNNYNVNFYAWNAPGISLVAPDSSPAPPKDDVRFLQSMVDDLRSRSTAAGDKLYGIGYSGGAWLLGKAAADPRFSFAGVASVKGTMTDIPNDPQIEAAGKKNTSSSDGKGDSTSAGTTYIGVHGLSDPVLPYSGGSGSFAVGYQRVGLAGHGTDDSKPFAQARYWSRVNGCLGNPTVKQEGEIEIREQKHCAGKSVEEIFVPGGHEWPAQIKLGSSQVEFSQFLLTQLGIAKAR